MTDWSGINNLVFLESIHYLVDPTTHGDSSCRGAGLAALPAAAAVWAYGDRVESMRSIAVVDAMDG